MHIDPVSLIVWTFITALGVAELVGIIVGISRMF
jgi:hypothetical protein